MFKHKPKGIEVKVVGCSFPDCEYKRAGGDWYKRKIGKVFEVEELNCNWWKVLKSEDIIYKDDCIILKEEKSMKLVESIVLCKTKEEFKEVLPSYWTEKAINRHWEKTKDDKYKEGICYDTIKDETASYSFYYNLGFSISRFKDEGSYMVIDGKKIKLSEETVRDMKEKLRGKKEALVWKPCMGERYWLIYEGGISCTVWQNRCEDKYNLLIGNTFKTEEICKKALADKKEGIARKFIKIENYVRNNWDGFETDFGDNDVKNYYIRYEYSDSEWEYSYTIRAQINPFHMSESMVEKVVKMLNNGKL